MPLTYEWRIFGEFDVVLRVEDGEVREAFSANSDVLHDFLAVRFSGMHGWKGDRPVDGRMLEPDAWGPLVLSRAGDGQLMDLDPERFWAGVHIWFRSRGVDYDTPVSRSA